MAQSDPDTPQRRIGELLRHRHATLATAESCTGGLIGSLLTDVSGSSDYYLGGVIAYSNQVKEHILGVQPEVLATAGAVSQETALQMAHGVRHLLGADFALAVTGIAGPTGATPGKPVGLVYIALVGPGVELCERHTWKEGSHVPDREWNKILTARRALYALIEALEERARGARSMRGPASQAPAQRAEPVDQRRSR
jgi:nicotinamide-nucleotide amidase